MLPDILCGDVAAEPNHSLQFYMWEHICGFYNNTVKVENVERK